MPGIFYISQEKTGMKRNYFYVLIGILLVACIAAVPFTSTSPDGLESTLESFDVNIEDDAQLFDAPVPDYEIPGVRSSALSVILAGIAGAAITLGAAFFIARLLRRRSS